MHIPAKITTVKDNEWVNLLSLYYVHTVAKIITVKDINGQIYCLYIVAKEATVNDNKWIIYYPYMMYISQLRYMHYG